MCFKKVIIGIIVLIVVGAIAIGVKSQFSPKNKQQVEATKAIIEFVKGSI